MKHIFRTLSDGLLRLDSFILFILLLVLIITTVLLACIGLTALPMSVGRTPMSVPKAITEMVMDRIVGSGFSPSDEDFKNSVLALNGLLIGMVGLAFTALPVLVKWRTRQQLRREHSIQTVRVRVEGKDDYRLMMKFLDRAENAVLFSKNFSWLKEHPPFLHRIEELAKVKKVTLVTWAGRDEVKRTIGEPLFSMLDENIVEGKPRIKATYIKHSSGRVFMHKFSDPETQECFVTYVRDREDSRFILDAMDWLCNEYIEPVRLPVKRTG